MRAEIIAVGTELLLGQITNTNATFLSKELAGLGIDVFHHTVVGDNPERLKEVLRVAEKRSDLIIFSGGLGPTKDDMTKQTIANYLGKDLVLDQPTMDQVLAYHQKIKKEMPENNKMQAMVIEGSTVLPNTTGLAAGMFLQHQDTCLLLLPGPPNELYPMFLNTGKQLLLPLLGQQEFLLSRVLRFYGIGESKLATLLDDLIENQTNPTLATYAGTYEVTLRLTAKANSESEANLLLDDLENQVQSLVGSYFYGYGDQNSLPQVVVQALQKHQLTITAAESLTGGLFQSELASIPGASKIFPGGFVTYSPEAKSSLLAISPHIIEQEGVVSEACAKAMAEHVRAKMATDIGVSLTGVAGPDELEQQPAGTVWIGLASKGKEPTAYLYHFAHQRNGNRERAVLTAFDLVRKYLEKHC
ncbi:competence/damage-inducible protein A [Isobaculum melis]|uniref:Putative competence-damage inducible protein n=1 Tax=Isobaculum melis TaxID=142588 RepID=A0A1H9RFS4_9LACT|nr:competence/damage-inducible protein A [Isobaculum melis]SER71671.1 competence/damage-inducible protein cinA [Isobaculum melis]